MARSKVFLALATGTVACCSLLSAGAGDTLDPSRIRMAEAATDQGDALLRKGEFEQAEKAFRRAIAQENRYPASHLGLGASLVATSRWEEALEALSDAKKSFLGWKAINDVAGLQNRQHYATRERATQDFARQLRQKSGVTPEVQSASERTIGKETLATGRSRLLTDRLRPEEMEAIPAQVFYLEGLALLRLGRREEGIHALEDCLVIEPQHSLSDYNLSVALFTKGDLREASQHLDAAITFGTKPHPQFEADLTAALGQAFTPN